MDPKELRAAAERLKKSALILKPSPGVNQQAAYAAVYKNSGFTRVDDEIALADAYLAEHPADEDEPITVEWIKRVIPEDPDHPKHGDAKHAGHSLGWIEWDSVLCVYVNGEGIYWQDMTRGRFRALCVGLGVPLTESTP